ncbi:MAG TPA: LacI family DNA-binding transcriptional regulator [Kribbella sp.]|jgi:LacI family transcriptional regulator
MVTMTDVARAAGVSVSTVSHVVNGTRLVAPKTRERVHRAMRLLGYEHHPIARSLAAGSNQTIGLAITAASNPYWVELIQGIDGEATRAGLNLIIVDTRDDARHEASTVANLLAHHIEGLVIAPAVGWRELTLPLLRDHPVPYVIVDRIDPDLRVDQVGVENEASTAAVVDHLISLGHTRIGMVAGIAGLSTSAERLRGYRLAHQRAELPVDPSLVLDGSSTSEGGRKAALALLDLPDPPTAVFAANNNMAIGALAALKAAGVRVPRDLAVAAFDDFAWADLFSPGLTTVAQPSAAIGARAVQLLLRRMTDPDAPPQTVRLPAEIMHRESCGCTPAHR